MQPSRRLAVTVAVLVLGAASAGRGAADSAQPQPAVRGELRPQRSLSPVELTDQWYAGQAVKAGLVSDVAARSSSDAEQAGLFRMTSDTGAGSALHYKMALGAETDASAGSAPVWAMTTLLDVAAGYPSLQQNQVSLEVDHNNRSGTHCVDADIGTGGTVPCGELLVTGAGTSQVNFGLAIAGNSQIRNGLLFATGGPIATSVRDYSASQVSYKDQGHHINGLDGSAAAYTGSFVLGPGGTSAISPAGGFRGTSLDLAGDGSTAVPARTSGVFATPAAGVALCPGTAYGCSPPATFAAQLAAIDYTTGAAPNSESGLFILMDSSTGYAATWAADTAYGAGLYVFNGPAIYRSNGPCTSGRAGGPTGTGTATDGSCAWTYSGPAYASSKNALNFNMILRAGAGQGWGAAGALQLETGWQGLFATDFESDASNYSGTDPAVGTAHTIDNIFLSGPTGSQPITNEIYISGDHGISANATVFSAHNGLWINGAYAIKDHDIELSTGANIGVYDHGTHAIGVLLSGRYGTAQLSGAGFSVSPTGAVTSTRYNAPLHTPASSAEACVAGDAADDAQFHYVCVAANHWRRVALSDF